MEVSDESNCSLCDAEELAFTRSYLVRRADVTGDQAFVLDGRRSVEQCHGMTDEKWPR